MQPLSKPYITVVNGYADAIGRKDWITGKAFLMYALLENTSFCLNFRLTLQKTKEIINNLKDIEHVIMWKRSFLRYVILEMIILKFNYVFVWNTRADVFTQLLPLSYEIPLHLICLHLALSWIIVGVLLESLYLEDLLLFSFFIATGGTPQCSLCWYFFSFVFLVSVAEAHIWQFVVVVL